ncbi:soluble pyridine nucleotide transhydrogenase [Mycobacterium sp. TKK-01-0059]|uniref:FAD-dependent oxidoreductase n=1 Tax=Mycobacterium sp. TKK-01-0059 TaxID=1324269 RepID=UPI0004D7E78D|nr:FAD-dependent oxidoreductase [Mycobacterium sp. TKK-01-0059]KEF94995.1 soluble pyridine nucleotide transhydrogenase [Mycobacterium sp. TKK-01-0059]
MHPFTQEYDLIVLGSGPGGQKAAIAAAKLGKSLAVIEHSWMLGGVYTNTTGTIPSKTLREAVLHLTGITQRELYGASYRVTDNIPDVSFVGETEDNLTNASIAYEVGVSRYRELARGQIVGAPDGMLKLLVSPDDLKLLGVHVFGINATELVHIGQAIMGCGGTVEYLVDAVFNYPTFAEAYKVAALDVMNKLHTLSRLRQ